MLVIGLALTGCSDRLTCTEPGEVLARGADGDALTCLDTSQVVDWMELLAGRPATKQHSPLRAAVRNRYKADPARTRIWLGQIRAQYQDLSVMTGFDGTGARSHAIYNFAKGKGLVTSDDGSLWTAVEAATSVWSTHDGDELGLTESDIEAWILYGSLCREVQGAGQLRISVADRLNVYKTVRDRWSFGTRTDRVALASMGPVWSQVQTAWRAASYETQQSWMVAAPLPPSMTATSLGYLDAILQGDLVGHAATIHSELGPFALVK